MGEQADVEQAVTEGQTGTDGQTDTDGRVQDHRGVGSPTSAEKRRALVRKRRMYSLLMWVLALLALFFAWASFGMMMRIGFLPVFDLGYTWFDAHVYAFFGIVPH